MLPEVLPGILTKSFTTSLTRRTSTVRWKGRKCQKKVQEAKDAKWQEYGKLRRVERKLQREILEDPGKRPPRTDPMFPAALPESHPMEWGGKNGPGKTQGSSSEASETMVESISNGIEELRSQQAQTGEATLRLVAAVSEVEEGTWEESPGLTEKITKWMDQQEDRMEELVERLERKQKELTRLAKVEKEDWAPAKSQSNQKQALSP